MDALQHALSSLPHGPEFRFLDRLLTLEPGKAATARYQVPSNAPYLPGHFPGDPLFPGVLLIEAAAQLAGIVAQTGPDAAPGVRLRLTALRAVKILGTARPGETIQIEARLLARLGKLVQAEATVRLGKQKLLQAELTLTCE